MSNEFLTGIVIGALIGVAFWDLYLRWLYRGGQSDD